MNPFIKEKIFNKNNIFAFCLNTALGFSISNRAFSFWNTSLLNWSILIITFILLVNVLFFVARRFRIIKEKYSDSFFPFVFYISFSICLFLVFNISTSLPPIPTTHKLEISAVDGEEVAIREIKISGKNIGLKNFTDNEWYYDNKWLKTSYLPNQIIYKFVSNKIEEKISIIFLQHPSAGKIRILINGSLINTLDLKRQDIKEMRWRLKQPLPFNTKQLFLFSVLRFCDVLGLGWILLLITHILNVQISHNDLSVIFTKEYLLWVLSIIKQYILIIKITLICLFLLVIYVSITTKPIIFAGDDWWVLSYPYWKGFFSAIHDYTFEMKRPGEGIYWITVFKIFGFNRQIFLFFSMLLLLFASFVFGLVVYLMTSNKNLRVFHNSVFLLSFLIPSLSVLTYHVSTDNSRLAALLFWISAFCFQLYYFDENNNFILFLGYLFYSFSVLTYEAFALVIWVVPFILLYQKYGKVERFSLEHLSIKEIMNCFLKTGFIPTAIFYFIRYHLFSGGLIPIRNYQLSDMWRAFTSYNLLDLFNITKYFTPQYQFSNNWILLLSLVVMSILLVAFISNKNKNDVEIDDKFNVFNTGALTIISILIFLLGVLPYLFANYGYLPGFHYNNRVFSSASYGLVLLFSLLLFFIYSIKKFLYYIIMPAVAAYFLLFLFTAREYSIQYSHLPCKVWYDYASRYEKIRDGSNLAFINAKLDGVVQGNTNFPLFIQMLYHNPTVYAFHLNCYTQDMFTQDMLNNLLIFKYDNSIKEFTLLDKFIDSGRRESFIPCRKEDKPLGPLSLITNYTLLSLTDEEKVKSASAYTQIKRMMPLCIDYLKGEHSK